VEGNVYQQTVVSVS